MNHEPAAGGTEPRAEVARRDLIAVASAHLTETVAVHLPFEQLGAFKTALKRFFSPEPWTDDDASDLSDLVAPHVADGWWVHRLAEDLVLEHGIEGDRYRIAVEGTAGNTAGMWDRVFDGPVTPEPTPHPQKVKFTFGGDLAPGTWYLPGDLADDVRARRLLEEADVSDVMLAGDFVTIGLRRPSKWEDRLDDLLDVVTRLFASGAGTQPRLSRDELIAEGQSVHIESEELHLLDPDSPEHRRRLTAALEATDARMRRIAVAILGGSSDIDVARTALAAGYADESRIVRRMAIDAAGDAESEAHRKLLHAALEDGDAWIRWRAVRALADLGVAASAGRIRSLATDPDFQVRFEAERALRSL